MVQFVPSDKYRRQLFGVRVVGRESDMPVRQPSASLPNTLACAANGANDRAATTDANVDHNIDQHAAASINWHHSNSNRKNDDNNNSVDVDHH